MSKRHGEIDIRPFAPAVAPKGREDWSIAAILLLAIIVIGALTW